MENAKQGIRGSGLKLLGVAGLVVVAGLFQGCGSGTGSVASRIETTWFLTENGQEVQCALGDKVEMRVDTDAMTAVFPCADHAGISPVVTGGVNHIVSLALVDASGKVLSQTSQMSIFVPAGTIVSTPDVEFPLPPASCADGQIRTSWVLTENAQEVQCAPGDEVDLRVDTDAMIVTFPCGDHMGMSPPVTGGISHNVSLTLYDSTGKVLSETPVMGLVVPCGQVMPTPKVEFSLTP